MSATASEPSSSSVRTSPPASEVPSGAWRALILVTLGFGLNFWAWSLLSPLGPVYVERGLTADAALIVAIPVLVGAVRSEEHTSELQSRGHLVCRLLLEKKKTKETDASVGCSGIADT